MTSPTKILFIGVDAADKDLILRWSKAGLLPTFHTLLDRGAWGPTLNPLGFSVGAIWPSFYTGVSPARHGRHCLRQIRPGIRPGTYSVRKFTPRDVKWEPFWNTLSRANKRVAIIDVPKTYPSEDFNGIQLVDWGTHDPDDESFSTWPPSLASDVQARFGQDPVGPCDGARQAPAEFKALRDALTTRVERKADLSGYFLEQGGWDLFLTVFSESHCVGHQCWHLHDPTNPRQDKEVVRTIWDPIKDVYITIDAAIGRLLNRVGPETIVFILCSHAMGPHYAGTPQLLDKILRRLENSQLSMAHEAASNALEWCAEGSSAALNWLRMQVPSSVRKALRPLRNQDRRPHQRSVPILEIGARRCFRIPNNDAYGGIRVNLVGREPDGRIRFGPEYEAFCEALSRDLLALVNLDTGRPAISRVLRTSDLYRGEHMEAFPDLLVEWNQEAPISSVYSAKTGKVQSEYRGTRTGGHKPDSDGLFFVLGPSIKPGPLERPVSVMDFAPTLASLLGVSLPEVEGEPIAALLGAEQATKAGGMV